MLVAVTSREVVPVDAPGDRVPAGRRPLRTARDRGPVHRRRGPGADLGPERRRGGAARSADAADRSRGVDGRPTVLSNAETFAQLAVLVRLGPERYAEVGTPGEPGTTLLTVTGAVGRPGVLEVPFGTTLGEVADIGRRAAEPGGRHRRLPRCVAGLRPGAGVVPGGACGRGGTLGAGAVIFVGQHTCALGELARVAQWLADRVGQELRPVRIRAAGPGRGRPATGRRPARARPRCTACAAGRRPRRLRPSGRRGAVRHLRPGHPGR